MRHFKILLCLLLAFLAGNPTAADPPKKMDVRVLAFAYYDDYKRKWHRVERILIEETGGRSGKVAECWGCGYEEFMEVSLPGLVLPSQYQITVTWQGGLSASTGHVGYEQGETVIFVDHPL